MDTYNGFTRAEGQHPDVFPSSPSGVKGVFIAALQSRFYPPHNPEQSMPWVWNPDPTPDEDGGGPLPFGAEGEAEPARRIYIGGGGRQYNTARNVLPALLVSRGRVEHISIGVGNIAAHDYPRNGEVIVHHAKLPILVDCLSREEEESETIADVVASFIVANDKALRSAFGLHGIGMPGVDPASIFKLTGGNEEAWSTRVTFEVEVQYKFWRWPLAPVFREVRAHLETNGEIRDLTELLQRQDPR